MERNKLGFGMMRLPLRSDDPTDFDLERLCEMVDTFLAAGFTYFDMSFVYHKGKSEEATRKALVERHPRDAFTIATKLPTFDIKREDEVEPIFEQQLEHLGIDYIDYYLLHNTQTVNYDGVDGSGGMVKTCHLFDHAKKWKEEGRIKHLGFSFHSSPELFDRVLTEYPEAEFVQIAVNYCDWEDDFVQARACYEIIHKHGKKVVIMEPVKGGCLSSAPKPAEVLLRERDPQASIASWAMLFVMYLPDVIAILSGMSTIEQVRDNIETFEYAKPLTEDERKLLERIVRMYKETGPLETADFSKYEGVLRHGVPVSSILDLYNTALIQSGPDSGCHICYLKNSIAKHAYLDSFGEMSEEAAITVEGEDITALVDKAEIWLIKRCCT